MKPSVPGPDLRTRCCTRDAADRAMRGARANELDPLNLFNITWRGPDSGIRHVVLPKELTGVEANIVVLVGRDFPSGSHKVGPAYATLMEGELAGEIQPGVNTIIGPSTGNFGIGVAYISQLKGYPAIVIMPEQMSAERYQRIRQYGGELDLTPGLGERRHPGAGAHRALQEGPAQQGAGAVRTAAQLPLPPLRHRPQRARSGARPTATGAWRRSSPRPVRPERWPPATRSRRSFPMPWSARWSRRSAPRCSTTAAARTASKASATRW